MLMFRQPKLNNQEARSPWVRPFGLFSIATIAIINEMSQALSIQLYTPEISTTLACRVEGVRIGFWK